MEEPGTKQALENSSHCTGFLLTGVGGVWAITVISPFLTSLVKLVWSILMMSSVGHNVGLLPSDELTGAEPVSCVGLRLRVIKGPTLLTSGLWAVWLLIQQFPCLYPLGGSLVLSSGWIKVLLCSSHGLVALRSLASIYLLCARKPVTDTFPSGWKKKLIPLLSDCVEALCSQALMTPHCHVQEGGALGRAALITLTHCSLSQGRSPSQGSCLCAI